MPPMRTVVVSDLHLGALGGDDVAREGAERDALVDAVSGADRLVLLGDVIELRERPLAESLEVARPVFEELGKALAGAPGGAGAGQPRPRAGRALAARACAWTRRRWPPTPSGPWAGRRPGGPDRRLDARRGAKRGLPGTPPPRGRLHHAWALPRPSPHDPTAGVDRGVRDGASHPARQGHALGRGLRGDHGPALCLLREPGAGRDVGVTVARRQPLARGLAAREPQRPAYRLGLSCSAA